MLTPFGYFDLIETFPKSGCAVCNLLRRDVTNMLDATLYEFVTDPAIQRKFRASRGLCNEHGTQLLKLGSALGIAVLYEQVIDELLTVIEQTAPSTQRGLTWRLFPQNPHAALASALEPAQPCMACTLQDESETQFISILSQHIADARMQAAFRASDGLCLEHFRQTVRETSAAEHAKLLIDMQRDIWRRLQDELNEFMRKQDFKNADEAMGAEGTSWQRAVARAGGEQGVFGLRRLTP
jgi:hypothetical protein